MSKNKILTITEMLSIGNWMSSNNLCGDNLSITVEIDDFNAFQKLHEDFYYRLNAYSNEKPNLEDKQFIVNVCGLKFIYFCNGDNQRTTVD